MKTSRRKRKGVGSRTEAQMAEGGSSSAAGERGREGDMEPGRVRETLREILMEIPGFQALAERGIALGRQEGAPAGAGPCGSEGPWQEAPAGPSSSENKEWEGPSVAEARLSLRRDDEGGRGRPPPGVSL